MELDIIYNKDCIGKKGIIILPDKSINMAITSPPYNVGIDYGEGREKDKRPFKDYYDFAYQVTREITRVLKVGGRFCIEIGGSGRNFPLSWCWQDVAFKCNLGLYSEITIAHRKTNPTAWGSWLKADNVYTIPNFHMAYVFYKGLEKKTGSETTITKDEFMEYTRGRWKVNYSGRATKHPAEFPLEILLRFMKLFGHKDDIVFDPFMGSGTTAVACKRLNRRYIGYEISKKYCKMAQERLEAEKTLWN